MRFLILSAFLLLPVPVQARQACPVDAEPIPAELSAWNVVSPVAAGMNGDGAMQIDAAETFLVDLHPNSHLALLATPKRAAPPDSFGGFLDFEIAAGGTYRIALSGPAWIELIGEDGAAVASTAHGHGPACSGMRKIVDFSLKAGRYMLQMSGAPDPVLRVMVVRGG